MIKTIGFLDTETSGVDPKKDHLIEVALVRWSVEDACAISAWSTLVFAESNDAFHVNRIPAPALLKAPRRDKVVARLCELAGPCDIIVAHSAEFDRSFLPELDKPWVCSMEDLKFPDAKEGGFTSVVALALAMGLGVSHAHGALVDAVTLARIFERAVEKNINIYTLLDRGMRPKGLFASLAPYEEKDVVKAYGFKWKPLPGEPEDSKPTTWWRRMAIDDAKTLPFRTKQIEG